MSDNNFYKKTGKRFFDLNEKAVFSKESTYFEDLQEGRLTILKGQDHAEFVELTQKTMEKIRKKIAPVNYMGFTLAIGKEIICFTGDPGWSLISSKIQRTIGAPAHKNLLSLESGFFSLTGGNLDSHLKLCRAKYFGFIAKNLSVNFVDDLTGVKISAFFVFDNNDISFSNDPIRKEAFFKLVVEDMQNYLPAYAALLNLGNMEKSSINNILTAVDFGIDIKSLFSGVYRKV